MFFLSFKFTSFECHVFPLQLREASVAYHSCSEDASVRLRTAAVLRQLSAARAQRLAQRGRWAALCQQAVPPQRPQGEDVCDAESQDGLDGGCSSQKESR